MLFDCQRHLAKNVHNGALPVDQKYSRDMLLYVDSETGWAIWKCECFNSLDEPEIMVGNEVSSQMRGDEDGIGIGDCTT